LKGAKLNKGNNEKAAFVNQLKMKYNYPVINQDIELKKINKNDQIIKIEGICSIITYY